MQGLNYTVAAKSVREFLAATSSVRVSGGETAVQDPQQSGPQAACEPRLLFEVVARMAQHSCANFLFGATTRSI